MIFKTVGVFLLHFLARAFSSIAVRPRVDFSEKQMSNNLPNNTFLIQKTDTAWPKLAFIGL